MTTESKIIRECSACSKRIEQFELISGNTFGATYWTDGKREAPMLPDQPWLVMCPHCHAPLWLDELKKLGEGQPWDEESVDVEGLGEVEPGETGHDEFKDSGCITPSVDDYFAVLAKGVATPEKERYVRLKTWWAGNDLRRTSAHEISISSREATNLKAFAKMLDESDAGDLIMKAEVMRELGCFDDARTLLARIVDGDLSQAVGIISRLVEAGDRYVREMDFESPRPLS